MDTQVVEGKAHFEGLMDRPDQATETLHSLLRGGYRSADLRDTVGEGILLHHDGDGPDLVLYPDGALHPVGLYRRPSPAAQFSKPAERPRRGVRGRLASVAKWAMLLVLAVATCFASIALWVAILDIG